jgi:hypothetical protein
MSTTRFCKKSCPVGLTYFAGLLISKPVASSKAMINAAGEPITPSRAADHLLPSGDTLATRIEANSAFGFGWWGK